MATTTLPAGIAVSFGNTPQGNLSETRLSAQNSRITLQATSKIGIATRSFRISNFVM